MGILRVTQWTQAPRGQIEPTVQHVRDFSSEQWAYHWLRLSDGTQVLRLIEKPDITSYSAEPIGFIEFSLPVSIEYLSYE